MGSLPSAPSPFGSGYHLPCDITAHLLPSALISIINRCLPGPKKGLYSSPASHRSVNIPATKRTERVGVGEVKRREASIILGTLALR